MNNSEISNRAQFVIGRSPRGGYDNSFEIGDLLIEYGIGFALTEMYDRGGSLVGIFLGSVVDFASQSFRPQSVTLQWDSQSGDLQSLERELYERSGSWIALISSNELRVVYTDACGSQPVVYSKEKGVAGSSAGALLTREAYFDELYDEARSESWFKADWYHTAGLTAHRSLLRLLPNHRLNFNSMAVDRIWPLAPIEGLPIDRVVREVAETSRETIEIAMRRARALAPLTAGNETRALLALLQGRTENALFFTGKFPGAVVDLGSARRLAKRFELTHIVSKVRPKTPAEAEIWRYRTGHCIGGTVGAALLDRSNFPKDIGVELSGAAGEVGRGFLWAAADTVDHKLSSEILLARLKLPMLDRFVAAVDDWLGSVKQFDALTIMDLAYIELKMACWAGPQAPGSDTDVPQIWPFSSRRCFSAMIAAPVNVRLDQSLFQRIVQQDWPQLLEIPINRGTVLENAQRLLYRASSPRRVWQKIRKNFAKMA